MRLMMLVTLFSMLCLAPAAQADPQFCDTIDDLAEGWATVADELELDADDEVGDLNVKRLVRDVDTLLEPTEDLGELLLDFGNRYEEDMGDDLLDVVEELEEVQDNDYTAYLVDRIDDIVDCMDHIIEYCDAAND